MEERKKGPWTKLRGGLRAAGRGFAAFWRELYGAFAHGDWKTRLSFVVMGFGCLARGQVARGLLYLAVQVLFIAFFALFGWQYLQDFGTLGTNVFEREWDESKQIYINMPGDNSMLILLYSVLTLFITVFFLALYVSSVRAAWRAQRLRMQGKRLPGLRQDLAGLLDKNLQTTLLTPPVIGVLAFTVLPVVFMILIAFTNFDRAHQPPGNLFTWVGLQNFRDVFGEDSLKSNTFFGLLGWTLIWAVFATFLNYFLGMVVALMINKKGIRLKGLWRTCLIVPIAVPAFVTLLLMSQMLSDTGTFNVLLQDVLGLVGAPVKFLTDGNIAKLTVIVVNLWIGIPYTMLITSGILMNIPADLFEAARIDGAGAAKQFTRITLPYMLNVTTPYLITQFVGNINNFNAIYFLTRGGPFSLDYYQAGKTDLLVTWLYKLTVDQQDYNLASTIGILVFVVCAAVSLATFNLTASTKQEEAFQ